MSAFFYCKACGHNLTFISNRRLKCYGCGKYFVDSYGRPTCNCKKIDAFRYSVEIIAPNKGKCLCCGREMKVVGNLEAPDIEKYGGSRGSGGLGSWNKQVSGFQPSARKPKSAPKTEKPAPEKVEVQEPEMEVYPEEKQIKVIGEIPGAEEENIFCEVKEKGTVLSISIEGLCRGKVGSEGRKRYAKEIELPSPVTKKVSRSYRNGVLEVTLNKRKAS